LFSSSFLRQTSRFASSHFEYSLPEHVNSNNSQGL
jgi:hypothetical protein